MSNRKLRLISHRGNLTGPNREKENHPDYIVNSLASGFDVEIDVWFENNKFVLGHDKPQFVVDKEFLLNPFFWCHAKNIDALEKMLDLGAHCFWHQEDSVTLTSQGHVWTYPNVYLTPRSVCVLTNDSPLTAEQQNCYGVCSDWIQRYKVV